MVPDLRRDGSWVFCRNRAGRYDLRHCSRRQATTSVMIQRQKAGLPLTQSHISPRSPSPRDMVNSIFEVDQMRARLDIKENGKAFSCTRFRR